MLPRSIAIALLATGAPAPLLAQAMVQPLGLTDADLLATQMRQLAANPRDMQALATAGELSLKVGDLSGAAALFARADKVDPRNGRVKAGMASILVRSERPGEALRFFQQAEAYGWPAARFAADRGLAYDLIGQQDHAQRDYRVALRSGADDETIRRYALSLGISGRQAQALEQLDPLVRRQDRAAWRARAFVMAMAGDSAGAAKIATSMMPAGMAQGLGVFLQRLPSLGAVDRAFAVHFGEVYATPERIADARLTPALPVLSPEPNTAPVQLAAAAVPTAPSAAVPRDRRSRRQRERDRRLAPAVATAQAAPVAQPPVVLAQVQPLPGIVQPARSTPPAAYAQAPTGYARVQPAAPAQPQVTYAQAPVRPSAQAVVANGVVPAQPVIVTQPPVAVTATQPPLAVPTTQPPVAVTLTQVPPSLPATAPAAVVASPARAPVVAQVQPVTAPPAFVAQPVAANAAPVVSAMRETDVRVASTLATPVATPLAPPAAVASVGTAVPAVAPVPVAAVAAPTPLPPVETASATDRADSVLARIVASLSIPASELGVAPMRPEAVPAPAAAASSLPAAVAEAPASPAGRRVVAEASAKEARDGIVRRTVAARLTGDLQADEPVRTGRRGRAAAGDAAEPADAERTGRAGRRAAGTRLAAADTKAGREAEVPLDPRAKRAADRKAVADRKAAAEKKALADQEAAEKRVARTRPARIWVQVAGGANQADLPKAWRAAQAKAPALAGKSGYSTPLRATNRVLTGPFKTEAEARAAVNQLNKQGVSAFTFTSEAGQDVKKLGAK